MRCSEAIVVMCGIVSAFLGNATEMFQSAMASETNVSIKVILGDNIDYLKRVPSESVDLIYVDPPFNTGKRQIRKRFHTEGAGLRVEEAIWL